MKNRQKIDILDIAKSVIPDIEYAPEESWNGQSAIDFQDSCGCYSEWTQEFCHLYVFLKGTVAGEGYEQASKIEKKIRDWASNCLSWSGCDCCGGELYVMVRLFKV